MKQKKSIELLSSLLPAAGLSLIILLRFLFIASNDVAMDEPFTVFYAQADVSRLFSILRHGNNPPLFFLVMHYWVYLFGISPLTIRILPCLFSIATAVMLYLTGTRFFSRQVGFVTTALFTLSDYHQLFAHEAREYALFAMLTTISMYCFLALAEEPRRKGYLLVLSLSNILLTYAHFFGFFIFLIQGVSVLIIPSFRKSILKHYTLSLFVCILAYLPYFPILFTRFFQSAIGGTWVEPPVISDLYTMVWRYLNAPVVTVTVLGILASALATFIFRKITGSSRIYGNVIVLIIWFLVPYLLMFFISFKIPMFLDRYTVFISVGFYLLVAVSIDFAVTGQKSRIMVMTGLIIMMAWTFHPRVDNKRRLKEAVTFISNHKGPHTSIILCPPWLEYGFSYHYDPSIFSNVDSMRLLLNARKVYPLNNCSLLDKVKLAESNEVFLFEEGMSLSDPEHSIRNYLQKEFKYVQTFTFYESFKIHQYKK